MNDTLNIVLQIPIAQALRFQTLTDKQKEILTFFVAAMLKDNEFDLSAIMDFIGFRAERNGLTPEIFEEIVNEKIS